MSEYFITFHNRVKDREIELDTFMNKFLIFLLGKEFPKGNIDNNYQRQKEIMDSLLSNHLFSRIRHCIGGNGNTLLHYAVMVGNREVAALLLALDASLAELKNSDGKVPRDVACTRLNLNFPRIIEALKGFDYDVIAPKDMPQDIPQDKYPNGMAACQHRDFSVYKDIMGILDSSAEYRRERIRKSEELVQECEAQQAASKRQKIEK